MTTAWRTATVAVWIGAAVFGWVEAPWGLVMLPLLLSVLVFAKLVTGAKSTGKQLSNYFGEQIWPLFWFTAANMMICLVLFQLARLCRTSLN